MHRAINIDLQLIGTVSATDSSTAPATVTRIDEGMTLQISVRTDDDDTILPSNLIEEIVRHIGNVVRNAVSDAGMPI